MSASVSDSALQVPHSRIRELAEIAMSMEGVLKLYFGESNVPTPAFIKEAAQKALVDGYTFYTENAGMPSLRRELAHYYERVHAVSLDPAHEIVITASGVQALNVGIRCLLDPGDEALILTPAWPNGSAIVQMSNAVAKQIAQPLVDGRYGIDFDALEAAVTPRTRMLLYTSPSNPLGWVATKDDQQRLIEFARRHQVWLVADEVYERLCYTQPIAPSILRFATREDPVMVVQSFSKSYCMTGWRLGWLVSRKDVVSRATQLNEFVISHAPSFVQKAGEAALTQGEDTLRSLLAGFRANRDYCRESLSGVAGLSIPQPDGAFYLFPKVQGLTDSFGFCRQLLMETRVGIAPGVAFGAGGEGSVRICYAAERHILEEAMSRIRGFMSSWSAP